MRHVGVVFASTVDPNTLNLDPDPGFWSDLDPDPGVYNQYWKKKLKITVEKFFFTYLYILKLRTKGYR